MIGLVSTVSGKPGATAVMMVLRANVARSTSSVRKLCTGLPSRVTPVVSFRIAAGERWALATTLSRAASAASLSASLNGNGGQLLAHMPFQITGQPPTRKSGPYGAPDPDNDTGLCQASKAREA